MRATGRFERRRQCKLDKEIHGKQLALRFVPRRRQPPKVETGVSVKATAAPRELDSTFNRSDQQQSKDILDPIC